MAAILKELRRGAQYRDRRFEGSDTEYFRALDESCTVYIGNLAFATREEQLYEVFSKVGPIDRVHMGLNEKTRRPCGFAFVVYHSHKVAEAACSYISGTKVDNRYIRVDMDWGFLEGRQYGRGKLGGQVRDEVRQSFDAGRMDAMANVYSKGMGDAGPPPGPPPVGQKRGRHSHHDAGDQDGTKRQREQEEEPAVGLPPPPPPGAPAVEATADATMAAAEEENTGKKQAEQELKEEPAGDNDDPAEEEAMAED